MNKTIQSEHIMIFDKYGGDGDRFICCAIDHEKEKFKNGEWSVIEDIYQDLVLIKKGITSKNFRDNFEKKIVEQMDADAIEMIKRIAGDRNRVV